MLLATICFVNPSLAVGDELKIGVGAAVVPQFEGADEYRFIPFPSLSFENDLLTVRNRGLGVEADFIPSPAFGLGPIISYDLGRKPDNIDDPVVSRLREIDGTLRIGGFVETGVPLGGLESLEAGKPVILSARIAGQQATDTDQGFTGTGSLSLIMPMDRWTVGTSISTTYASSDYMNTKFGITPADSAASGLPQYNAQAGFKDVGVGFFTSYKLDENWSVNGVARYSRLIGDAADSPIVQQRGTENQGFVGLSFTYTLGLN